MPVCIRDPSALGSSGEGTRMAVSANVAAFVAAEHETLTRLE